MFQLITTASIDLKVDEEGYMRDVGAMWDIYDTEEPGTVSKPELPCGYGKCWDQVTDAAFKLSCEMNLDLETDSFCSEIKLLAGHEQKYREFYEKLKAELKYLSQWVSL